MSASARRAAKKTLNAALSLLFALALAVGMVPIVSQPQTAYAASVQVVSDDSFAPENYKWHMNFTDAEPISGFEWVDNLNYSDAQGGYIGDYYTPDVVVDTASPSGPTSTVDQARSNRGLVFTTSVSSSQYSGPNPSFKLTGGVYGASEDADGNLIEGTGTPIYAIVEVTNWTYWEGTQWIGTGGTGDKNWGYWNDHPDTAKEEWGGQTQRQYYGLPVTGMIAYNPQWTSDHEQKGQTEPDSITNVNFFSSAMKDFDVSITFYNENTGNPIQVAGHMTCTDLDNGQTFSFGGGVRYAEITESAYSTNATDTVTSQYRGKTNYLNTEGSFVLGAGDILASDDDPTYQLGLVGCYFDTGASGTDSVELSFGTIYGYEYPVDLMKMQYYAQDLEYQMNRVWVDPSNGATVDTEADSDEDGYADADKNKDGWVDWDDGWVVNAFGFIYYDHYTDKYHEYNPTGFFSMTPEYVANPPKSTDAGEQIYKFIDSTTAVGASNPVDAGNVINWRVKVVLPEAGIDVRAGYRADRLVIEDTIHPNMTYVQGSMQVTTSGFTAENSKGAPVAGTDFNVAYGQDTSTAEYVLSIAFSDEYVKDLQMNHQEIYLTYQTVMGEYPSDWDYSRYEIENTARVSMEWDEDENDWNWRESNPAFTDIFKPTKLIEGSTALYAGDEGNGVELEDHVTYALSQQVHRMDDETINEIEQSFEPYSSFVYYDELPAYVTFGADDTYRIIDSEGTEIAKSGADNVGVFTYDAGNNIVSYEFSPEFLKTGMIYNGRDYTFEWTVTVIDQPKDDLLTVDNFGFVTLDSITEQSNTVSYEPASPKLSVTKYADLEDALASAIADFEFLSRTQNDQFSLVQYRGSFTNVADKTRTYDAYFEDELPKGLDLVPGSVKVTGIDADRYEITEDTQNNVIKIYVDRIEAWEDVSYEYQCTTNDSGNGKEVVNTATIWAKNVDLGNAGAEDNPARNDGEIYINDPNLVVTKTVSESDIQEPDYQGTAEQQKEEYRVGDEITYTVTLVNDVPGTFAHNVKLTDDDMPAGMELVGDVTVSGLANDGKQKIIFYPLTGSSDEIHGQGEDRTVTWNLVDVQNPGAGTWGWELNVNYLPYNYPVTVTWTVKPTDEVNGWEIYNQAFATAENQPDDVFASETPCVWINTPEFDVAKYVDKTDSAYQVGDHAQYNVELFDLKTPGTLARLTTLSDLFAIDGADIIENSFVVTDVAEKATDIADKVEFNRNVGDNKWHIDMTQVYGDETGYWVNAEGYSYIWSDGALSEVPWNNPLGVTEHSYFKVQYEAAINDMALQNLIVTNDATADSKEGYPVKDTAEVTVIGAVLNVNKTSNNGSSFEVGDVAEYEVTVTNTHTGTVAEDVQITDGFTTAKAGAAMIVDGTIRLFDNQNNPIDGWTVEYVNNEAGNHIGFAIDTNYDLSSGDKITVRYDMKYLNNNGSEALVNVADAWAANAPKVTDAFEVWPADVSQSDLIVGKGSDEQSYAPGSYATYTLNVTNKNASAPAENVTIHDEICVDTISIAHIVKGTVRVYDHLGNAVAAKITYHQVTGGQIYGFTAETGATVSSDEALTVVYQVKIEEDVEQSTQIHNVAWAAADNTGKSEVEHDILVDPEGPAPGPVDPKPDTPGKPDVIPTDEPALAITKSADAASAATGDVITWTVSVRQIVEGYVAEDVQITDVLPAGLEVDRTSISVTDASGNKLAATLSVSTSEIVASVGDLAYNTPVNLVFKGTIADDFKGDLVKNVAKASADNVADEVEDSAVVSVGTPTLTVSKSASASTVKPGGDLAWVITVAQTQNGAIAENVVVTDELPAGFIATSSDVSVTDKDGKRIAASLSFEKNILSVSIAQIAYGNPVTITVDGAVSADYANNAIENVAKATAENVPGEVKDDAKVSILDADPAIKLTKTADRGVANRGDTILYAINAKIGDADLTNLVLTDAVPSGLAVDASSISVMHNGKTLADAGKLNADGTLTVAIGAAKAGDSVAIVYKATVSSSASYGKTLVNTVTATADNLSPVKATATVTVQDPTGEVITYTDTTSSLKGLDKTGDELASWLADSWAWLLAGLAACIAACWFVPRLAVKDEEE